MKPYDKDTAIAIFKLLGIENVIDNYAVSTVLVTIEPGWLVSVEVVIRGAQEAK